jgi:hypothetical protein
MNSPIGVDFCLRIPSCRRVLGGPETRIGGAATEDPSTIANEDYLYRSVGHADTLGAIGARESQR